MDIQQMTIEEIRKELERREAKQQENIDAIPSRITEIYEHYTTGRVASISKMTMRSGACGYLVVLKV